MFEDVPIKYFAGSHRIKAPKETIEATESKLRVAGITRLTEITHLDRVGIPVFSAIRPTAQEGSVSIYAGKGATVEQAKASAMMEGFERYSGEKQDIDKERMITDSYENIENAINPKDLLLPKNLDSYNLNTTKLEWIEATDIISEEEIYIPANAVFHPYIPSRDEIPSPIALFKGNTNGLASGNIIEEAVLHGIFEVIERDAWSIFEITKRNKKEINKESIENEIILNLLDKFEKEGIKIKLIDLTADLDIPTIAARGASVAGLKKNTDVVPYCIRNAITESQNIKPIDLKSLFSENYSINWVGSAKDIERFYEQHLYPNSF